MHGHASNAAKNKWEHKHSTPETLKSMQPNTGAVDWELPGEEA